MSQERKDCNTNSKYRQTNSHIDWFIFLICKNHPFCGALGQASDIKTQTFWAKTKKTSLAAPFHSKSFLYKLEKFGLEESLRSNPRG